MTYAHLHVLQNYTMPNQEIVINGINVLKNVLKYILLSI